MFPIALLRPDVVERKDMQSVKPWHVIALVRDEHNVAANCDKIRMLLGDTPPVRQTNPEGRERALAQPVANGFYAQHRLPIVDGTRGVRKETRRLDGSVSL